MRIVAISEAPYARGKWERFDIITDQLRRLGHEVLVLSLGRAEEPSPHVVSIDIRGSLLLRALNEIAYRLSGRIFDKIAYVVAAGPLVLAYRPDVMVYHYASSGVPLILLSRLLDHCTLVYDWNDLITRMSFWPRPRGPRYRILRWLEETLTPRLSDRIVVLTDFARSLLSSWGIPEGKVFVLNEIIDLEPFHPIHGAVPRGEVTRGRKATLVWHGYARPYQVPGIRNAIEAVARLRETGASCRLEVIGPWTKESDLADLRALARRLQVPVDFMGAMEKIELRKRLAKADIGLHLLPRELFARFINGVKLSEYLCSGLPVICTDLEGPAELLDRSGYRLTDEDPSELAEKARLILSANQRELARESLEIAEREFSDMAVGEKVKRLAAFLETSNLPPT